MEMEWWIVIGGSVVLITFFVVAMREAARARAESEKRGKCELALRVGLRAIVAIAEDQWTDAATTVEDIRVVAQGTLDSVALTNDA